MSSFVSADIVFTEIFPDFGEPGEPNQDDDAHEWMEVFNTGSQTVVFDDTWYFEDATIGSFWRGQCWNLEGSLDAGEFGIISKNPTQFMTDYPDYTGAVIETSFTVQLHDEEGIVRLYNNPEDIFIGSNGRVDCDEVGQFSDEVNYESFGEGFSIERCVEGLIKGPLNGNPGETDCANIIPEFNGLGFLLAGLGTVFFLFVLRR